MSVTEEDEKQFQEGLKDWMDAYNSKFSKKRGIPKSCRSRKERNHGIKTTSSL